MAHDLRCGRFGENVALVSAHAQAFGPHPDLLFAFFARNIQHLTVAHRKGHLKHKRRLSDARFAANQHQGSRDQSAAKYPVKLLVLRVDAVFVAGTYVCNKHWSSIFSSCRSGCSTGIGPLNYFFGIRIPFPA